MTAFHAWAPKPPMGWNSWHCFGATVTEEQVRAQADYMSTHLARFGWQYIVVGNQWYDPNATLGVHRSGAELVLDAWGRLLPAPDRFPSCARGLKPLGDYLHDRGLKLGVHVLRGIPRGAVERNLPIFGRSERARDIARIDDARADSAGMYGVDMSKPGAQSYYDSVFSQLAEWGVDYVEVDVSRPYHESQAELEGIRGSIDQAGRPMVLSLSPGPTDLSAAEHVKRHANLWRINDDFLDHWDDLQEQLQRLRGWNPHRGTGHWPDADLLPLGALDRGRRGSRFTADEQRTLMTLCAITRSPLMHGGDMTQNDDFTLSLLTNREVLEVNQDSQENQPLFEQDGLIAWVATAPNIEDKYLALFNSREREPLVEARAIFVGELRGGSHALETLLVDVPVTPGSRLSLVVDDGHGQSGQHHAVVWGEPILRGGSGDLSLTELEWQHATSHRGSVSKNQTGAGLTLLLGGRPLDGGLAVHAKSIISFEVPVGYTRFVAECGFEGHTLPVGGDSRSRCLVFDETPDPPSGPSELGLLMSVSVRQLGFEGPVMVRDLWEGRELGTSDGVISKIVPWRGAALFRIAPQRGQPPRARPRGAL